MAGTRISLSTEEVAGEKLAIQEKVTPSGGYIIAYHNCRKNKPCYSVLSVRTELLCFIHFIHFIHFHSDNPIPGKQGVENGIQNRYTRSSPEGGRNSINRTFFNISSTLFGVFLRRRDLNIPKYLPKYLSSILVGARSEG